MRRITAHYIFPICGEPLRNAVISIDNDGKILAISKAHRQVQQGEGIEFYNGIIAPAFVNAHCHLELSHLRRKIPQGCGMPQFIQHIGHQRRQPTSPTNIAYAIHYADSLLYQSGVSAVMDISNGSSSFKTKQNSRIAYHTFIEKFGLLPSHNTKCMEQAHWLLEQAQQSGMSASITPHAAYSVSEDLMHGLMSAALPSGIVSIHHQETRAEQDMFENGGGSLARLFRLMGLSCPQPNGMHSLRYISSYCPRSMRMIFVHNTYMSAEHYDYAQWRWNDVWYVLCPQSNLYIENAMPPISMLRQKGARLALGTDSFASHPTLMLMDDILLIQKYYPEIPLNEILTWATLGGAQAMRLDTMLGSIEAGKRPGLVWIEGIEYMPILRLQENAKAQRIL
jgi:cytosine/adenosine deaminase-related metal-dependent hydrolase